MSKRPLDTSHQDVIYITPFLQTCKGMVIALIHLFCVRLVAGLVFDLCRWGPTQADQSTCSRSQRVGSIHVLFKMRHIKSERLWPWTHQHTPLRLFKGVLCFKFHHSCTNTHAQTVLPVLTNLHPVWRWLTGVFNYADCTSSMYNTSPRLWVLLTSCQSWRWVRLWMQWHVNYIKVNIQPLCCFSALTGLFPVSLSGWTLTSSLFLHQHFPSARTMIFGELSPTGLNCSWKLKLFFMNGLFLSPKKIHSEAEWNLPVQQDFMRLWMQFFCLVERAR